MSYSDIQKWLSQEVILKISKANNDPEWMRELRFHAWEVFKKTSMPFWWPDLSGLNLDEIVYFASPDNINSKTKSWDDVPENIKQTFDKLWIPEAEKEMLAWVWAQYDSKVVYHSLKKELQNSWVIFEDMSVACIKHEKLLKKYFMKAVPVIDHKFAALHWAVWSWGTFLYIPAWIKISEPLQAYFRMNVQSGWQFEHTIIVLEDGADAHYIEWCSAPKYWSPALHAWCVELYVGKNARLRYSSVENWSADTYNLNTKRAIIEENWFIEWVGWNMWAWVTMLYPCSVLVWNNSRAQHLGFAFASENQIIDTWAKVIHIWENTSSKIISKWVSKWWWESIYRWYVNIRKSAKNAINYVECDSVVLDEISKSDSIPYYEVNNSNSTIAHEARAWKIDTQKLFYLQSRWISEEKAKELIVWGFLSPVIKELPLEYAAEMNVLINMELEKIKERL